MLKYNFEVLPYEWEDFVKKLSKHPNVKYTKGKIKIGKDKVDMEYVYKKDSKTVIAAYDRDEDYKVYTDLTKRDFFMFIRGIQVDIMALVSESETARISDFEHVIMRENAVGVFYPIEVVKGSKNALKYVTECDEIHGIKHKAVRYDIFLSEHTSTNWYDRLVVETAGDCLKSLNEKVENDEQLKKYIDDRLKRKFGDKFDQKISDKIFKGLKDKYNDYGAMVGAVR